MKTKLFAVTALLPLAAACAFTNDKPSVLSSTPQGVTIEFEEGNLDDATEKANEVCAVQNRTAVLQQVSPEDDKARIASFECR